MFGTCLLPMCKNCPYSELFWSVFPRIRTEYREILRISPCSVQMSENANQNNFEYGHVLHKGISSSISQTMFKLNLMNLGRQYSKVLQSHCLTLVTICRPEFPEEEAFSIAGSSVTQFQLLKAVVRRSLWEKRV